MHRRFLLGYFLLLAALCPAARAQQVADTTFAAPVPHPAFAAGKGPVVLLDEAHGNFHTASGRYRPFAEFLRRDGYVVQPFKAKFTPESLGVGRILVIANALVASNQQNWALPTPSAFSDNEIAAFLLNVFHWLSGLLDS
jgi:hypothetical protein